MTELERYLVMVDQTNLVLFAFSALGFLGIFLLFQRIRRAVKVKRILQAGGNFSVSGETADQKFVEKLLREDVRLAEYAEISKHNGLPRDTVTEQTFRNMFFTAANKGEGLIEYYMTRHKCGRTEAMRRAIEEREREGRMFT